MSVDLQLKLWLNNLTEIWRSEKTNIEQVHFQFCKRILKVRTRTLTPNYMHLGNGLQ